jgi:uncharacterized protein (DUF302 family)
MKTNSIIISVVLAALMLNLSAQEDNSYYLSKLVNYSFEVATKKVKESLKEQEFGIITEIDMDKKLAEKLDDIDVMPYRILGACNPKFAYKSLQIDENIGLFLPCKVLIKQVNENSTEIVMVNPSALMLMLGNDELVLVAEEVTERFRKALEAL